MSKMKAIAAIAGLLSFTSFAQAQDYPTRSVVMIVPFAAGGPTDVLARPFAQRLGEVLGQQVVVENLGGVGGMLGAQKIAQAVPDGYQVLLGTVGTQAYNQTLYKHPLYDATSDFTPVALIAEQPLVLETRKDLPVNNFKEFIAYAKTHTEELKFGSGGAGSGTHLGCLLLNTAIGVNIQHIPYKGSAPAVQDLIAGRLDYVCDAVTSSLSQIRGNTVKPIAVLSHERSPVLPNVPTAEEQGLKNFETNNWIGLFLPRHAPDAIVRRLHEAIVKAIKTPELRARLAEVGTDLVDEKRASPDYLKHFVGSEIEKWAGPIKASGVSMD